MADWLPEGWQVETENAKDGSPHEFYTNKTTGQVFDTKEAMLRYANYLKNVKPLLDGDSNFKKCYAEGDMSQYVDRPWEDDKEHSLQDYLEGKVGKSEELKGSSGSSSGPTTDAESAQIPKDISKGKAPGGSSGSAMAKKVRRKQQSKRKTKACLSLNKLHQ